LRTRFTRLHRSGGRVCVSAPVSEGLDLSRPRGICPERVVGLSCSVQECNQFQRVSTGEVPCMKCVTESAWLCRCCRVLDSVSVCGFLPLSWFCCGSMVSYQFGHCLSVACSCPRAERTCPYPFPRGWCRACCCGPMRDFFVRPFGCCSIVLVAALSSCCCPVLCSCMRAELACTCLSPGGWCRVGCGRAMEM